MSINRVNISGNLTRDAELRQTQGGSSVLTFGVAVNDRRKDPQTGEWKDYPNFIDCIVFGNRATSLANILTKGMKVAVEGKLRWSQWERDGQKRSKVEVVVDEVELMQRREGQGGYQPQGGYQQQGYATGGYVQQPAVAQPQPMPQANPYGAYQPQVQPQAQPQQAYGADVAGEEIPF